MSRTEVRAQTQLSTVDHRTRLARKLNLPQPDIAGRRKWWAEFLDRKPFLPHKVLKNPEGETLEPLEQFAELVRDQGYAGVVAGNHLLKRDFIEIFKDLWLHNEFFLRVEHIVPVGDHQWKDYLPALCNYFGITPARTATHHAREAGISFERPLLLERAKTVFAYAAANVGKGEMNKKEFKQKMQGKRRGAGEMLVNYLDTATKIIDPRAAKPGVEVVFPQAGREASMTPFEGGPVRILVKKAKRKGIDKIAFLVVGIGEKGSQNNRVGGYRPAREAELKFQCLTLEEGEAEVERRNEELRSKGQIPDFTIDDLIHEIMATLVPEGYKPKTDDRNPTVSPSVR